MPVWGVKLRGCPANASIFTWRADVIWRMFFVSFGKSSGGKLAIASLVPALPPAKILSNSDSIANFWVILYFLLEAIHKSSMTENRASFNSFLGEGGRDAGDALCLNLETRKFLLLSSSTIRSLISSIVSPK